jgi:hypothetical protein
VRPAVSIVVELPQVDQLMQRARVRDEVAHQLLVEPALVEGGVAKLAIGFPEELEKFLALALLAPRLPERT